MTESRNPQPSHAAGLSETGSEEEDVRSERPSVSDSATTAPHRPTHSSSSGDGAATDKRWAGRLEIVDEVGRGAMGTVLRAVDIKLRRELALKVTPLPKDKMPREMLARFVEEAQISAQLEHPNVVPVHDFGLDPHGHPYFSMKLIRGESLEAILAKREAGDAKTLAQFGLRRLLDVFLQVCQAIEYAHARGVVHRDIKPANIMVGDFGEVLVMDWGVAKLVQRDTSSNQTAVSTSAEAATDGLTGDAEDVGRASMPDITSVRAMTKAWQTQHGIVIGTPSYMSPEQAKGIGVDERADIYSLGVILYEILCGAVPFDDEDPKITLSRVIAEPPEAPSKINPKTPLALEALALRMLEKQPERRMLSLPQIRAHVHNYIEGIGHDYRRESIWSSVLWSGGALVMFAFLVWYLTGRSIGTVLAIGPPAVLNAVGWFMFVLALGYPLWAMYVSFRQNRQEPDRFRPPESRELFVSGYLGHRTFSAAMAPLFQLVFIVELVTLAVMAASRGSIGTEDLQRVSQQMRTEWSEALIIIIVFLFAYLFLIWTEVRFARRIDRYELLVRRPRWESVWPFFMIIVLLSTLATTDVLDWVLSTRAPSTMTFVSEQVLAPPLDVFEIVKTLVFQGTFLLGLVVATTLVSFPFAELLASLRVAYQPADEASVRSRLQYFTRSLAVFRVARMIWLYGGAMIASLTAMTILSEPQRPLVEKVLYILGPSLIGFSGYLVASRYVRTYLKNTPALERLLDARYDEALETQRRVMLSELAVAPTSWRLAQLLVPIVCLGAYLMYTGSGIGQDAIRGLILPVTTKGWLLIIPYALLVPLLLLRDTAQRWLLERRLRT